jgi:hypothetical protein
MIPNCTLVTACFDLRKFNSGSRTKEETIRGMIPLLQTSVYMIIHTDNTFMSIIKEIREKYGFSKITQFIEETYDDLWSSQFTSNVKANRELYWPSRDERTCAENHLLTCNKFDFVLDAIHNNPFNTERFGWIDMNLHIENNNNIKICEEYTTNIIPFVLQNIQDDKFHIQILNVNDKRFKLAEHKREYYEMYRWVVCGCFFVCGKNIGEKILNRLKEVVEITTNLGYGHGEEPMYIDILDEFYNDIERSYGDYGQILNNFIYPTRNLYYIFEQIAKGYFEYGYYTECNECCEKMLYSFENHLIEMDNDLYIRINSLLIQSKTYQEN